MVKKNIYEISRRCACLEIEVGQHIEIMLFSVVLLMRKIEVINSFTHAKVLSIKYEWISIILLQCISSLFL